jgi:hypothetical protein
MVNFVKENILLRIFSLANQIETTLLLLQHLNSSKLEKDPIVYSCQINFGLAVYRFLNSMEVNDDLDFTKIGYSEALYVKWHQILRKLPQVEGDYLCELRDKLTLLNKELTESIVAG